jgi:hypothetical protein
VSIPTVVVTRDNKKQENSKKENEDNEKDFNNEKNTENGKKVLKDNEKLRARGFAFVTFLCEIDAEKAVNGTCG